MIDVHAHIQIEAYLQFLASVGLRRPSVQAVGPAQAAQRVATDDAASVAARIAVMDAAGVRTQVLSPTLAPYLEDEAAGVHATRLVNDAQAQLVRQHPGRLASYVSLPLPHVEASLAELRRGMDELGAIGVTAQCACLGTSIADPRFEPLFAEMNRRRAILALHPAVNGLASPLVKDWSLTAAAGPIFEDAVVALHLMVKGIPARYPDVRIIIPHLGGGLATMLERLDNQLKLAATIPEQPSVTARRFWYDTVSHGSPTALRAAVSAFGADRILPGSDFPVLLSFESYSDTFGYVERSGLARGEADAILHANARRLFGV
ncbi:MAG: Amidohydrolase [Phenylobacterium sp.]|nr:Amidohydrolase [Phenylobacterium sp.]